MKKIISWMERAGALALFLIIVLITFTTLTRYFFNWVLPDGDNIAQMLLAIAVLWGFASACLHGEHIQFDIATKALPARLRRVVLTLTGLIVLAAVALATYAAGERILDLKATGQTTYDVGLPLWPFYAVAVLGLVMACISLAYVLLTRSHLDDNNSSLQDSEGGHDGR